MASVPGHLGGYVPGGDAATWYPDLWDWLIQERGVRSVLDVGCGDGQAVDFFKGRGVLAFGIDGVPQDNRQIVLHDFTEGPFPLRVKYDLVWSCEFVEHVEERFVPNFLETFRAGQLVLMTHAEPGQLGHHHVNCRPAEYWIGAMAAVGYELDQALTAKTITLASRNRSPWNHYRRSGLAFRAEQ